MEDYEELMLQISDVMREANRVRPDLSHEQAIKNIRGIVERHGKWNVIGFADDYVYCKCSECGNTTRLYRDSKNEFCCIADIRNKVIACLYCGAKMDL